MSNLNFTKLFEYEDAVDSMNTLPTNKLKYTRRNTFELYTEDRLSEMVDSIKNLGILTPLLVVLDSDGMYEVLAGNNRLQVAKMLEMKEVPVRILESLTEEEKDIIIAETNLHQRSFSDLNYSQKSYVIYVYHNAVKKQGKRTDLLAKFSETNTGNRFGLGKTQLWKYTRFYSLINPLKSLVDDEIITFGLGVKLTELSRNIQENIYTAYVENKYDIKSLNTNLIEKLKLFNDDDLSIEDTVMLLTERENTNKNTKKVKKKAYTVNMDMVYKYIPMDTSDDEKNEIIEKALELYYSEQDNY